MFLFYRRIYPQSLLPLQNTLKTLHLHGNEWVCDCKLQPFREWVIEKKLFNRPTQCMEPARLNGKMWNEIQKQDFACKPEVSILTQSTMVRSQIHISSGQFSNSKFYLLF